jgi:hypothetical protein
VDLQAYYSEKRYHLAELQKQFPQGFCHVCSIGNKTSRAVAGSVTAASLEVAARCLTERTHRLATDDEVKGWLALQEENRKASQLVERLAKNMVVVQPAKR